MNVGAVPGSSHPRPGDKRPPVWPLEVESVATVSNRQIHQFRKAAGAADLVWWATMDRVQAEHQTLITDRSYFVELRWVTQVRLRTVALIRGLPREDLF